MNWDLFIFIGGGGKLVFRRGFRSFYINMSTRGRAVLKLAVGLARATFWGNKGYHGDLLHPLFWRVK